MISWIPADNIRGGVLGFEVVLEGRHALWGVALVLVLLLLEYREVLGAIVYFKI